MPLYDFRCRTCDATFEVRRPMAEAGEPATCPEGHTDTVRLMSVFAAVGAATATPAATPPAAPCGGSCACFPG